MAAEESPEPAEEPETAGTPETESAQNGTEYAEEPETNEADTLTISLPDNLTDEDFAKLQNLVDSKANLFRKALGTDNLTIQRADGKISFPWFHGTGSARAQAYAKLVTALCQMAKKSKRITAKEHEVLNENTPSGASSCGWGSSDRNTRNAGRSCWKTSAVPQPIGMEGKKMRFPNKEMLEFLRREYPSGTRVILVRMDDPQAPPLGTKGTVTGVDDMGSILVDWDNGSHLNVIHGVDVVQKLNKKAK